MVIDSACLRSPSRTFFRYMNYISIISLKYIYFFTVFAVATIDQNYVTNYFLCIDFFVIKKKYNLSLSSVILILVNMIKFHLYHEGGRKLSSKSLLQA